MTTAEEMLANALILEPELPAAMGITAGEVMGFDFGDS